MLVSNLEELEEGRNKEKENKEEEKEEEEWGILDH